MLGWPGVHVPGVWRLNMLMNNVNENGAWENGFIHESENVNCVNCIQLCLSGQITSKVRWCESQKCFFLNFLNHIKSKND